VGFEAVVPALISPKAVHTLNCMASGISSFKMYADLHTGSENVIHSVVDQ